MCIILALLVRFTYHYGAFFIKETSFVYHGKRRFFLHFGQKSGKINRASARSIGFSGALFFVFRARKWAKTLVYFLRFFTLQRNRKRMDMKRFEPLPNQDKGELCANNLAICFRKRHSLHGESMKKTSLHQKKTISTARDCLFLLPLDKNIEMMYI